MIASMATISVVAGVTALMMIGSAMAGPADKVMVCHVPPGNPGNADVITIVEPDVKAHLKHGDSLGVCVAQF